MLLRFLSVSLLLLLAACQTRTEPSGEDLRMRTLTMPTGEQIRAEVLIRPEEVMRGMMFRPSLPPDRGLLFIHRRPGRYSYWMHNVKVPLDIIWLDKDRNVVEVSLSTPPCQEQDPVKCPQYGGKVDSRFVLELAGGMAAKYNVAVGSRIEF